MNLLPAEIKAIGNITSSLQPFVQAKFQKPIKLYSDYDLEKEIADFLTIAYMEMGLNSAESHVLKFLRETLLRDLRGRKYETVTMAEVRMFVSCGIRGDFGTFKNQLSTINIPNIHYWIRSGLQCEERKIAMKEFFAEQEKAEKTIVPVKFTPEMWRTKAVEFFNDYRLEKDNPDETKASVYDKDGKFKHVVAIKAIFSNGAAAGIYDYLCEERGTDYEIRPGVLVKTLVADAGVRLKLVKQAKAEYADEKRRLKIDGRLDPEREKEYDQVTRKFEMIVKKHYLLNYFDSLINSGKEL
jgi:hypothetical protein